MVNIEFYMLGWWQKATRQRCSVYREELQEGTPLYEMVPISYNILLAEKEFI